MLSDLEQFQCTRTLHVYCCVSAFDVGCLTLKAGSQYDTGSASVMSVANVVGEIIFFTSQIQFLMTNL